MFANTKIIKLIILTVLLAGVFLAVYSPHFSYSFPFHVDEWHHISEALRFHEGNYFSYLTMEPQRRAGGLELGFHLFLFIISLPFNLVLSYKFLPAFWAVLSALALFYVVYKKTADNFWVGIISVIFFGSIKSNVNLMGLWFFTPLTFSIPFIFLYFYFFDQGIQRENIIYSLASLLIMIFLVFFHPISVLFSLPIFFIYCLFNYKYLFKEFKFLSVFIILFIVGLFFYKVIMGLSFLEVLPSLFEKIQFELGWGVLELKNSPLELYSWLGYLLAIVGAVYVFLEKKLKIFLLYLIWPAFLILLIVFYHFSKVSILVPYQRSWYYLVISLPLLSALGLSFIIREVMIYFDKLDWKFLTKQFRQIFIILIIIFTFFLFFYNYYDIPKQVDLYQVINENDYQTLLFISTLPPGLVLAPPFIATALYPISGQEPLGTIAFYGDRNDTEAFFLSQTCEGKEQIAKNNNINYVISPYLIDCPFVSLIKQIGSNYIYE